MKLSSEGGIPKMGHEQGARCAGNMKESYSFANCNYTKLVERR